MTDQPKRLVKPENEGWFLLRSNCAILRHNILVKTHGILFNPQNASKTTASEMFVKYRGK